MTVSITIGRFQIIKINPATVIIKDESGEGGEFPVAKVEAAIAEMYAKEF